jgi:radical SAM-linked protein
VPTAATEPPEPLPEARQRWRLVLARDADVAVVGQRELIELWLTALEAAGLPLHRASPTTRPKLAFGASLGTGIASEGELLDLVLTERWPVWQMRTALVGGLPDGWRLVDLYDVWLGGPPLAGRVAAADYRAVVTPVEADLAAAAASLLAAGALPRERAKGDRIVVYDLRPLLVGIGVATEAAVCTVRLRARIHPELGTGRPDEVIAALGDEAGAALTIESLVRERLLLADELED